jgi:7-cyano-7-deazaguanine synthase
MNVKAKPEQLEFEWPIERKPDAAVLFSGGLDSTCLLDYALWQGHRVLAINIGYGAAHNQMEAEAARKIVHYYRPKFSMSTLSFLHFELPTEVMMAYVVSREIPGMSFAEMLIEKEANVTIFPGRNALLISAATAAALTRNIYTMYVGMGSWDAENNLFPDCTLEFLESLAHALKLGYSFSLLYPFQSYKRPELIQLAAKAKAPLHLTYSCYKGGAMQCGRCPTCVGRRETFWAAGFKDPTDYAFMEVEPKGLVPWPTM